MLSDKENLDSSEPLTKVAHDVFIRLSLYFVTTASIHHPSSFPQTLPPSVGGAAYLTASLIHRRWRRHAGGDRLPPPRADNRMKSRSRDGSTRPQVRRQITAVCWGVFTGTIPTSSFKKASHTKSVCFSLIVEPITSTRLKTFGQRTHHVREIWAVRR